MAEAVVAVIAVIVGAVLGASLQHRNARDLDRRRFGRESRAATRVIYGELGVTIKTLEDAKRLGHWLPIHDLPLDGWDRHSPVLANAMNEPDFNTLVELFARLRRLSRVASFGSSLLVRNKTIDLEKVPELEDKIDELLTGCQRARELLRRSES